MLEQYLKEIKTLEAFISSKSEQVKKLGQEVLTWEHQISAFKTPNIATQLIENELIKAGVKIEDILNKMKESRKVALNINREIHNKTNMADSRVRDLKALILKSPNQNADISLKADLSQLANSDIIKTLRTLDTEYPVAFNFSYLISLPTSGSVDWAEYSKINLEFNSESLDAVKNYLREQGAKCIQHKNKYSLKSITLATIETKYNAIMENVGIR